MPPPPDPLQDGLYRAILMVLVASICFGALLTIGAETLWQIPGLSRFGAGVVLVCGAIYGVFRWLGWREARKRAAGRAGSDRGDDADPGR